MATQDSIVAGLFSTPEQYQQAQNAQMLSQASQLAQLDPYARANTAVMFGAGQIGRALGSEDPMLQRQSQRRALIQQIDMSNPESLVKGIQASTNDPELSSYLMGKYKELTNIQKEQSVIEKNKNFQQLQADATQKRNIVAEVEDKLSRNEPVDQVTINKAKLAFGDISRPKVFQQADGTLVTYPPTIDASMFPNIGKAMSAGSTGGGTKVAGVVETPTSIAGKEKAVDAAASAISGIDDSLNAVKGIRDLRSGSISTNPWLVGTMKNYPSAAMAQEGLVKTITAGKVIDTISEMKQQSKTGATGFGALNGRELDQLEAKARLLNPQSPTFEADLKYIEDKLIENKKKIQEDLAKKKAALPAANWQNPQGNAGRIAILNAELAKATNPADIAGLKREIASLGGTPSLKLESQQSFESKILKTLKASGLEDTPKNREAAIKALNEAGHK
jgi:hypothetical protein